jgi:site-specific DNA-cytosine methylase
MYFNQATNEMTLYTVNYCCGIGGQDLGFDESSHEYKGIKGKFETLIGFDNCPVACKNFERVTGNKAICADLFTREQYIMFHGKEPGPEWEELTPQKVRELCRVSPDVIILSPPCKGFSRLLPQKTSKLPKYQALNMLPERIFDLTLEAWFDDLPAIILMENVPGIKDKGRGQETLKGIKNKLALRGYVFYEGLYDCGEWGGLGQHRVRYLLIARLPSKVPSFVFQPPKLPLKTIGDILGPLPMPGDVEKCGRLHRIPNLAWRTWERLALIPAGKDWRALENFGSEQWGGAWKIIPWDDTANAVTSSTKGIGQSTGASAVADPRIENVQGFRSKYRVVEEDETSPTVTGSRIGSGALIYADPKVPKFAANAGNVSDWNEPAGAVIGGHGISNGALSVADPRNDKSYSNHYHCFKVSPWDESADTVTSGHGPTSGSVSVADPRLNKRDGRYPGTYKVVAWDESANTLTGQTDIQSGALNVSDPRISSKWSGAGNYGVMDWNETAKTVTASGDIHASAAAVADPRIPSPDDRGLFIIIAADGTWHRPITTFEGAMLQGFPMTLKDGTPFDLIDCSDGKAREYIGNAVPVQTATAIGNSLLETMMPNFLGEWHYGFDNLKIWVSNKINEIRGYFQ